MEGVDYAASHPTATQLKAAGKGFACRYGGPGGDWKHATLAEVKALTAAGVAVVASAEGAADGLMGGWSAGHAWATMADAAFRLLGMPASRPIYLSIDFNADARHWPMLDDALRGAASVLGANRVGAYGSFDTIEHFKHNGLAKWFWQTYAWSDGRWHDQTHIRQYRNHVTLGSGTVDLDRSMVPDFGQWRIPMPGTAGTTGAGYTYQEITGRYPVLHKGASDTKTGGTRYVWRAQRLMGMPDAECDGIYGDRTRSAVRALDLGGMARSSSDGSIIGESEWRKLLGAWR